MNAHAGFADLAVTSEDRRHEPMVNETFWGYIVRPPQGAMSFFALSEIGAVFSGVLLMMLGAGQWLIPGAILTEDLLSMKIVTTTLFISIGLMLFWIGRRGLVQELHLDRLRGELRFIQRNHAGQSRLVGRLPFDQVESVFIHRSEIRGAKSKLYLREAGRRSARLLYAAKEAELIGVRDRLIDEMSPKKRKAPAQV
jgi:hypothetical protein